MPPVLLQPRYARYLSSRVISTIGDGIYYIFALWWLKTTTGSDALIALVALLASLPRLLLGVVAGILVDRLDRRKLIIFCDSGSALLILVITLLLITNNLAVWHVAVVACLLSILDTFSFPAYEAIVPQLVERSDLSAANGVRRVVLALADITGPALGGLVISAFGNTVATAVNMLSFFISAVFIVSLPLVTVRQDESERETFLVSIRNAARYLKEQPLIWGIIVLTSIFMFFTSLMFVLLPGIAKDVLLTNSVGFGILEAALPFGFLLGGILAMVSGERVTGTMLVGLFPVIGLLRLAFGMADQLGFAVVFLALSGVGVAVINIVFTNIIQLQVPNTMQGRVYGLLDTVLELARPLAFLVVVPIRTLLGSASNVVILCGIATALLSLVALRIPGFKTIGNNLQGTSTAEATTEVDPHGS